jgi:hypothetical protein
MSRSLLNLLPKIAHPALRAENEKICQTLLSLFSAPLGNDPGAPCFFDTTPDLSLAAVDLDYGAISRGCRMSWWWVIVPAIIALIAIPLPKHLRGPRKPTLLYFGFHLPPDEASRVRTQGDPRQDR